MTLLQKHLKTIGACGRAVMNVPKGTPQEVWDNGTHPRWMIWWAEHTEVNEPRVVYRVNHDLKVSALGPHCVDPVLAELIRKRLKCPYDGR
jgi:hypothetical protein